MIDYCSGLACCAFSDLWVILSPLSALYFKYYLFYYSIHDYYRIIKDISSSGYLSFLYFLHSIYQDVYFLSDFSQFFIIRCILFFLFNTTQNISQSLQCPFSRFSLILSQYKFLQKISSLNNKYLKQTQETQNQTMNNELKLYWKTNDWANTIKTTNCTQIRNLNLCHNRITNPQVQIIVQANFENLEELVLNTNQIGADGIKQLVTYQWTKLKSLQIWDNEIGDQGSQELFTTKNLKSLNKLDISSNKITWKGLITIPQSMMNRLSLLNLRENIIGAKGVKLLVKAEFPNLRKLQIRKCSIGDEGAKYLTKGNWRQINELDIANNNIKQKGFITLMEQGDWRNLCFIWILENKSEYMHNLVLPNFGRDFRYYTENSNEFMKDKLKIILDGKFKKA